METILGYKIILAKEEETPTKLIKRIRKATGFTPFRSSPMKEKCGAFIYTKNGVYKGTFYDIKKSTLIITFALFKITNDTIREFDNRDEVLDLKAQIDGILTSWTQRKIIGEFEEIRPNLKRTPKELEEISTVLGRLRIPIPNLIESTKSFPKDHPYQFALLMALIPVIASVILFLLGKITIP